MENLDHQNLSDREHFVTELSAAQSLLYRYIFSLLPNSGTADDVLQETNLVLWRKADGPPVIETFIFPEHSARYLKLAIHTFCRAPVPSTSAGLNEIRIFGPSMPLEMKEQILRSAKPNPDTTP